MEDSSALINDIRVRDKISVFGFVNELSINETDLETEQYWIWHRQKYTMSRRP